MSLLLSVLKKAWPGIAVCVALGLAAWGLHHVGYVAGDAAATSYYKKQLAEKQSAWDTERRQLAESNQAALKTALDARNAEAERGRALAQQLEQKQADLKQLQQKLSQKEIENATLRDGAGFTGIGPDSLRLYLAALGYPDDQSSSRRDEVPKTANGNAVGATDARTARYGLTPQALLSHIKRYGQWCLSLKNKLESLNDYYDGDRNEP